jgi:hypothetical protein
MSQSPPLSGSIDDIFRLGTGAAKNAGKPKGNTSSSLKSQSSNNTPVNNAIISYQMSQSPPLSGSIGDIFRLDTGAENSKSSQKNADKPKGNTSSSPKSQSSNNTRVNNKIISSPAAATREKKSATSQSILRNLSEKLKKKNGPAKFTQKHYEQYIKDYIKKTDKDVIDLNKTIIKSVDAKIPHEAVVTSPDDCENALKIIKYHLLHYNLINEKPIRMIGKPTV